MFAYSLTIDTPSDYDRAAGRLCQSVSELWTRYPQAWTQHSAAVTKAGVSVTIADPNACAWCAMGIASKYADELFPNVQHADRVIIRERAMARVTELENARMRRAYTGLHQVNDHAWTSPAEAAHAFARAAVDLFTRAASADAPRRQMAEA